MARTDHALAKIEIIPFDSLTLSREQFLRGERDGAPARLAGELRLPQVREKPPTVLLIHGSAGIRSNILSWADYFVRLGMAAFVVDCFNGRGITGVSSELWKFATVSMIVDVYESLRMLARHPRLDPGRIAVMGWSRGGSAAVYAGMRRFLRMHAPSDVGFAAHIGLYPFCNMQYLEEEDVADAPIRIFHGAADDMTPLDTVQRYIGRLQQARKDAELIAFDGAYHNYDIEGEEKIHLPALQNPGKCFTEERAPGVVINRDSGLPDSPDDPCVGRGTTFGYHRAAHEATKAAVTELFSQVFKLSAPARRTTAP